MKNNILISLNINGYNHQLTDLPYNERLTQILRALRDAKYNDCDQLPAIIGLQEVILGSGEKYYKLIQELMPEYKIIKPHSYEAKNYKSAINLLLVKRDILIRYVSKQLSSGENGRYLYNYIDLTTRCGRYLVFNLHLPQLSVLDGHTNDYKNWRKDIREELLKCICKEIARLSDAKIILIGDLNCLEKAEEISKLKALNMINITEKSKPTYFNSEYGDKAVDYMFVSSNMVTADSNVQIHTALVDDTISKTKKLTDHALLITLLSQKENNI